MGEPQSYGETTPEGILPPVPPPLRTAEWHLRQAQWLLTQAGGPVSETERRQLVLRAGAHGKLGKRIAEVSLMMNPPWMGGHGAGSSFGGQGGGHVAAGGGGGGSYGGGVGGAGGAGGTWRPA
jgi:hypothetical protein